MDQVTQRNAAMVEETTAVTHRLSDEATGLTSLVKRFQLAEAGSAPAHGSASARGSAQASRRVSGPAAAAPASVARPSPAHKMVNQVRQAFSSGGSAAAEQEWSEF
jgi:methyl-accepting chemotaxis protein